MLRITIPGAPEILGRPRDGMARVQGLFVAPGGFQGWDDGGGETRQQNVERPGAHGLFDLPIYQGARVVTIDGHALAWSEYELGKLRRQVAAIGARGPRFRVFVEHQGETLSGVFRRGAKPTFEDAGVRHGLHRARFMIQLVAADPRLYGKDREYSAGEPVVHYGNFPAAPWFEVVGPHPAYSIGAGAKLFVVDTAVPAGSTDTISMASGWARRDGVLLRTSVSRADTWEVQPGLPGLVHMFSGDSSKFTVRVTDTYV